MLESCGFRPVYKNGYKSFQTLNDIEIEPINSLEGAELYNHLKNIFPKTNRPKYILTVGLSFSEDLTVIQQNSDIVRKNVTAMVSYILKEINSEKIILKDAFFRTSSFSVTYYPYSNVTQKHEILKNLAELCAESIRNKIILHIEKSPI